MLLVGAAWLDQHFENRASSCFPTCNLTGCCEFFSPYYSPYAANGLTSQIHGFLKLPYIAVLTDAVPV